MQLLGVQMERDTLVDSIQWLQDLIFLKMFHFKFIKEGEMEELNKSFPFSSHPFVFAWSTLLSIISQNAKQNGFIYMLLEETAGVLDANKDYRSEGR